MGKAAFYPRPASTVQRSLRESRSSTQKACRITGNLTEACSGGDWSVAQDRGAQSPWAPAMAHPDVHVLPAAIAQAQGHAKAAELPRGLAVPSARDQVPGSTYSRPVNFRISDQLEAFRISFDATGVRLKHAGAHSTQKRKCNVLVASGHGRVRMALHIRVSSQVLASASSN